MPKLNREFPVADITICESISVMQAHPYNSVKPAMVIYLARQRLPLQIDTPIVPSEKKTYGGVFLDLFNL